MLQPDISQKLSLMAYGLFTIFISSVILYACGYVCLFVWHILGCRPRPIKSSKTKFCARAISLETTLLLMLHIWVICIRFQIEIHGFFGRPFQRITMEAWPNVLAKCTGCSLAIGICIYCTVGLLSGLFKMMARWVDAVTDKLAPQQAESEETDLYDEDVEAQKLR